MGNSSVNALTSVSVFNQSDSDTGSGSDSDYDDYTWSGSTCQPCSYGAQSWGNSTPTWDEVSMGTNYTFTENGDPALPTSGSCNLDFFTQITRSADYQTYIEAFNKAWTEDKQTACQVLMNMRDVRGGKGEKLIPIVLIAHLRYNISPDAYVALLKRMIEYGYWKDLLRIYEFTCRCNKTLVSSFTPEIDLIVEQLRLDVNTLNASTDPSVHAPISLCAKWAPSEYSHFNQEPILAANCIMKALGLRPRAYRKMLTRLRNHLSVLETLMSTKQYDRIDFSKVPSVAMNRMRSAFNRNTNADGIESEGRRQLHLSYSEFLAKLSEGKVTVNVKGIQPHELVSTYWSSTEVDLLVEGQWVALKQRVLESGAFRNVTAVVDVSGSMEGVPMQVAVALGILVGECTHGPFHGRVITFDSNPIWHMLQGSNLMEQVTHLRKAPWGGSTNLRATFDLILKSARDAKLRSDEMVQTLFIFTDMQFDSACSSSDSTFEYARKAFSEAGYQLPKIVCWNLRSSPSKTMPVPLQTEGYAMLSGFSSELLKSIITASEFTPEAIMRHVLEPYLVPPEIELATSALFPLKGLEAAVTRSAIKPGSKKASSIIS